MLTRPLAALLLAVKTAYPLSGTAPFFLLSTQVIHPDILQNAQLAAASTLEADLQTALVACDASLYVFIEQPGVRASDLKDGRAMPLMQQRMRNPGYSSIVQIPEVMGDMHAKELRDEVTGKCEGAVVKNLRFPVLLDSETYETRMEKLRETDAFLGHEFPDILSNFTSHVLIFTSTPIAGYEPQQVEMDELPFQGSLHVDLKRSVVPAAERKRQAADGNDFQKGLPLFERYQFLSPGIFMGLTVSILLFVILYVGITAISGLQVSYMAFSKEMGPQAQKKQQ